MSELTLADIAKSRNKNVQITAHFFELADIIFKLEAENHDLREEIKKLKSKISEFIDGES